MKTELTKNIPNIEVGPTGPGINSFYDIHMKCLVSEEYMKYPCNTYFIFTSRAAAGLIDDCIIRLLLLLQDGTFASFGLDDVFSVTKTTDFDEFHKIQKKVRKNYFKKKSKNYFKINNHFQIKEGKRGGVT